jgi:hypothetical protein
MSEISSSFSIPSLYLKSIGPRWTPSIGLYSFFESIWLLAFMFAHLIAYTEETVGDSPVVSDCPCGCATLDKGHLPCPCWFRKDIHQGISSRCQKHMLWLSRQYSVVRSSFVTTRRTTIRWGWHLSRRGYIFASLPHAPPPSAVGIATGYRLDDRGNGVRVPVRSTILTFPCRPDRSIHPPI